MKFWVPVYGDPADRKKMHLLIPNIFKELTKKTEIFFCIWENLKVYGTLFLCKISVSQIRISLNNIGGLVVQ